LFNPVLADAPFFKCFSVRAKDDSMTCIESDINSSDYWQAKGCELCAIEQYHEAISAFDLALSFESNDCRTWNYRGNALSALHRQAEALSCYDKATALSGSYHQAWFNRGLLLSEIGAYGSALASYDRAIKLYPDSRYLHARAGIGIKQKLVLFAF
jgi:tetratricopeptide (TPR) repeat protein